MRLVHMARKQVAPCKLFRTLFAMVWPVAGVGPHMTTYMLRPCESRPADLSYARWSVQEGRIRNQSRLTEQTFSPGIPETFQIPSPERALQNPCVYALCLLLLLAEVDEHGSRMNGCDESKSESNPKSLPLVRLSLL
jgi:hypothetical protein